MSGSTGQSKKAITKKRGEFLKQRFFPKKKRACASRVFLTSHERLWKQGNFPTPQPSIPHAVHPRFQGGATNYPLQRRDFRKEVSSFSRTPNWIGARQNLFRVSKKREEGRKKLGSSQEDNISRRSAQFFKGKIKPSFATLGSLTEIPRG